MPTQSPAGLYHTKSVMKAGRGGEDVWTFAGEAQPIDVRSSQPAHTITSTMMQLTHCQLTAYSDCRGRLISVRCAQKLQVHSATRRES